MASSHIPPRPLRSQRRQSGIVLFIALVILVLVSLVALVAMRTAASTEKVSAAARTTELAAQAAEIALRHCEASVVDVRKVAAGKASTYLTTFAIENILPVSSMPLMNSTTIWDSSDPAVYVLPKTLLNQSGLRVTYQRAPECMVVPLPVVISPSTTPTTTAMFVITARGFGPEVADTRARPNGAEIWLQSHITLE